MHTTHIGGIKQSFCCRVNGIHQLDCLHRLQHCYLRLYGFFVIYFYLIQRLIVGIPVDVHIQDKVLGFGLRYGERRHNNDHNIPLISGVLENSDLPCLMQ